MRAPKVFSAAVQFDAVPGAVAPTVPALRRRAALGGEAAGVAVDARARQARGAAGALQALAAGVGRRHGVDGAAVCGRLAPEFGKEQPGRRCCEGAVEAALAASSGSPHGAVVEVFDDDDGVFAGAECCAFHDGLFALQRGAAALAGAAGEYAAAQAGPAAFAGDGAVEARRARIGDMRQGPAGVVGRSLPAAHVDACGGCAAGARRWRTCWLFYGNVESVARRPRAGMAFDRAYEANRLHGLIRMEWLPQLGAERDPVAAARRDAEPVAVDRVLPAGPGGPAAD